MQNFTRSMTVLVSSVALVGASLMGAAGATAAPGDVSEIGLAAGSTPRDVAEGIKRTKTASGVCKAVIKAAKIVELNAKRTSSPASKDKARELGFF